MFLRQTSQREKVSLVCQGSHHYLCPMNHAGKHRFAFLSPPMPSITQTAHVSSLPRECCCLMAKLSKTTGLLIGVLEHSPPPACPDSLTQPLQHPNTGNTGQVRDSRADHGHTIQPSNPGMLMTLLSKKHLQRKTSTSLKWLHKDDEPST